MRLALKFVLAFMLGNILLAGIYGYLAVKREVRLFQQTATEEAQTVGRAMEETLANAWRTAGPEGVQGCLRKVTVTQEQQMRIRWVWFDSPPGSPDAPATRSERLAAVTIERRVAVQDVEPNGAPALHTYWPVALNADRRGGLEFSHPMARLDLNKREIILHTALLVGGMVLLSGLLAAVLGVRFVGRPLRQLIEKTRRVAAGDLSGPIQLHSHDELTELAENLNAMCAAMTESQTRIRRETGARLAATEQLRHADRLTTVGRLAAGIAHQLGTPLNVVAGRAGLVAAGKLAPNEIAESAAAIKGEADKMTKIVRQLLDFARANTPHKAPVDLRQVVAQTVDMLHTVAEKHNVQLCFARGAQPAAAAVDSGQIQQVLTNLTINAIQATPSGGKIEFAIRRQSASPPDVPDDLPRAYYGIEVRDYGVGIAEENMGQLFEPFFTTKGVGEGTGLGLSIAYGIVQEHGGWIDVASRPGEGSCFTVFLPEGQKS